MKKSIGRSKPSSAASDLHAIQFHRFSRLREAVRRARVGPSALLLALVGLMLTVAAAGQTQDVTPPVLVGFSFSPTSIDVSSGSQNVTVTMHVTDDLSGVSSACAYFFSPSGQQQEATCSFSRTSGSALDGI